MPGSIYVTATSEKNSYGMTQGKWFDGKMELLKIYRNSGTNWAEQHKLQVTKIDEVINLDYTCSHDSYYQCLAKRFRDFKTAPTLDVNGSKCYLDQLCTPYSLPLHAEDQIPICTNEKDKACYGYILSQLDSEQTSHCKKSCHVKEYAVKKCGDLQDVYCRGDLPLEGGSDDNKQLIINMSFG